MRILLFIAVLLIVSLACATGPTTPRPSLYPSPTVVPTQTERVELIIITSTPLQPIIIEVTPTRTPSNHYCVSAMVAVHLRPSPSIKNYPIVQLQNGWEVIDLGGRNGKWWFVRFGDKDGWVDSAYIGVCNG